MTRTHIDDHEHVHDSAPPAMRRSIDSLLPFFIGLVLGVTTTFASFSGRLTKVETLEASDHADVVEMKRDVHEQRDLLLAIASKLGVPSRSSP